MTPFEPFPGLPLWYWPGKEDTIAVEPGKSLAAVVAAVLEDGTCNLSVADHHARWVTRSGVPFLEFGASHPKSYCTITPLQDVTLHRGGKLNPSEVPKVEVENMPTITDGDDPEDTDLHEEEKPKPSKGHKKR